MAMIQPTIGRVMWYWPARADRGEQPWVGLVAYIHGPHMVNLGVLTPNGVSQSRTSVPVVQDESPFTVGDSPYCEWMPFQKGQAQKNEQLEAQLKGKT